MPFARFHEALALIAREGRTRTLETNRIAQGVEIEIEGQRLLNFCSNDYLGLAGDPLLAAALAEGARRHGVGAGAASLLSGYSAAHHALAEKLAAVTGRSRALLFSSGYLANIGLLTGLVERDDRVYSDTLNHASLIDGVRLARAHNLRYPHTDAAALDRQLDSPHAGATWIVTDGLFSMDGDLAPLPQLAASARRHGAILVCDDAHGFGVLGAGRGTLAHFRLDETAVPLLVVTFGKALGTAGAAILGPDVLIETLLQRARTFIYDTASPPALAYATTVALDLALGDDARRARLTRNVTHFRQRAGAYGIPLAPGTSPIQPLMVGEGADALDLSARLRAAGFYVRAIRPPTVPAGTARLRICLSAGHEISHIDRLADALEAHRGRFRSFTPDA
ncbi:MAG: 8-amino-7-oxononanoate synthase [Gammaproteobacteria bacterium]